MPIKQVNLVNILMYENSDKLGIFDIDSFPSIGRMWWTRVSEYKI